MSFPGSRSSTIFALVGGLSVANGVLVELVMLARLFYGMAHTGQLPAVLVQVHPRTETPMIATSLAGGIILAAALLVPFEHLLVLTNLITPVVFALVDLALRRVKRSHPPEEHPAGLPRWPPLSAAALCVMPIVAKALG